MMPRKIKFHKRHEFFLLILQMPTHSFLPDLKNIASLTDREILVLYRKTGDRDLVGELFRRYTRFVFLVCMKYLGDEEQAKDASMQIFENLMAGLRKHDVETFKPWLHTVAKNHCLYQLRGARHLQVVTEELKNNAARDMESGYELHQEDDKELRLTKLEDAILLLSKEQRICIELFYLKKKCYQEIMEITGSTFDQVKSHLQNGKRNLKILMNGRNE